MVSAALTCRGPVPGQRRYTSRHKLELPLALRDGSPWLTHSILSDAPTLSAHPAALQLRTLQTMAAISVEQGGFRAAGLRWGRPTPAAS